MVKVWSKSEIMKVNLQKKFTLFLIISIVAMILVFLIALTIGRFQITPQALINIVTGNVNDYQIEYNVLVKLRIPRTLMALLVGIALALSGLVYQETFQNRLVSPDLLGVSSGASVGVALGLLMGLPLLAINLTGFLFGIIAMITTLFLARIFKSRTPTILILAGVIISGFMSSVLSIIKTFANTETVLPNITYWLLGSFDKTEMSDIAIIAPIVIIGAAILLVIRWKINIISLGEEEAITKGVNYKMYRLIIIMIATLLTAASVSFAGVIGWVGLVIPHIVRIIIGRNTKYTIPLSITFGAIFMMISDVLSRSIFQAEIPLSAVTGFIGLPIFILILTFSKKEVNNRD